MGEWTVSFITIKYPLQDGNHTQLILTQDPLPAYDFKFCVDMHLHQINLKT